MEMKRREFFAIVYQKIQTKKLRIAIEFAYNLAKEAHRRQRRENGERYFSHVKAVALIVLTELNTTIMTELELTILVVGALLHDLIEDTFVAREAHLHFIFDQVSPEITEIISTVTKGEGSNKHLKLLTSHNRKTKKLKGCDRLHNQRTLDNCKPDKIRRKNQETREVILPWLKFRTRDANLLWLIDQIEDQTARNEAMLDGQ
jgi:GTP pyrophosphokinase